MQGLRLVAIRRSDRVLGMIARLKGEIWEALPGRIVVGAGGVGYLVNVPLSTYDQLNPLEGGQIDLRIYQLNSSFVIIYSIVSKFQLHFRHGFYFFLYGFATFILNKIEIVSFIHRKISVNFTNITYSS